MWHSSRAVVLLAALMLATVLSHGPDRAAAAPGGLLFTLVRTDATEPRFQCLGRAGVGVAFSQPSPDDPAPRLWYSCQDPVTRQTSNVLHWLPYPDPGFGSPWTITDDQGRNIPIEALAWDPNTRQFWAVDRIPLGPVRGGVLHGICAVWRLDPATDNAQLAFSFTSGRGCDYLSSEPNFFDGLTVDPVTDTLYLSPANARAIRHFNKDGTRAANDPIDFAALTHGICGGSGCRSSGLLAGVNGHLISATGEAGKLVEIDPNVPSVVAVYDSGAGRDWGLSCGPIFTLPDDSPTNTIVSADLLSPNINVLQAPPGICDANDYAIRNAAISPSAEFSAVQGQVVYRLFSAQTLSAGRDAIAAGNMIVTMSVGVDQAVPHRIIAAPGDHCLILSGEPFNIPLYTRCAEGDPPAQGVYDPGSAPPPSNGASTCYDGVDNDADGVLDGADTDCRQTIDYIHFTMPATGSFDTFYRAVAFLCYVPSTDEGYGGSIAANVSGAAKQTDVTNDQRMTPLRFHCASN